jgi:hypothetical protein
MTGLTLNTFNKQRGVSLSGLIMVLVVFGVVAVFAMKVLPSVIEFRAIKDGIAVAKSTNGTVREMQQSFDKNADINGVTSIKGRDLIISKETGETEISFAYQKWIPLGGPVNLVIDYAGTTNPSGDVAKAKAPE